MWCTVSCATPLRQHLPSRPGSHQHAVSGSPGSQAVTLRHLSTTSLAKVGRWRKLMMAFIVPGLLTWSLGIAEVSLVPGRACANTWYSSDAGGMPEASSSEMRRYWLPIAPLMLAHSGLAGSSGGRSEEHTSELQSLMRNSYAVFCLKKKKQKKR